MNLKHCIDHNRVPIIIVIIILHTTPKETKKNEVGTCENLTYELQQQMKCQGSNRKTKTM